LEQGTGGMKLVATLLVQSKNIEFWVVSGHQDNFLLDALNGEAEFSKILAS